MKTAKKVAQKTGLPKVYDYLLEHANKIYPDAECHYFDIDIRCHVDADGQGNLTKSDGMYIAHIRIMSFFPGGADNNRVTYFFRGRDAGNKVYKDVSKILNS